jgi:NAD(P)-dependent dehydrogenase (short-subunit alcohol dehydrogenase family)
MSDTPLKVALVTGAGSGIGRAIAQRLSTGGWTVALLGRGLDALKETAQGCSGNVTTHSCDIGDAQSVSNTVEAVASKYGRIDALVNSAGMNIAARSLEVLSIEDFQAVLQTNLQGAFNCVHAVLPIMRPTGGTIVNINSEAGRSATAKAGSAYVVSKFGMTGLTESINAEERGRGIRATSIFPGDVNTPLLDKRPVPPPSEMRAAMVQPEDVAECAYLAISLPPRAIIEELVVRPAY